MLSFLKGNYWVWPFWSKAIAIGFLLCQSICILAVIDPKKLWKIRIEWFLNKILIRIEWFIHKILYVQLSFSHSKDPSHVECHLSVKSELL